MRRLTFVALFGCALLLLGGCNTIAGVARDVSAVAEGTHRLLAEQAPE